MKKKYIVLYKFNKESKERFKVFTNFIDAITFYMLKSDYCVSCKLSIYEELVCGRL